MRKATTTGSLRKTLSCFAEDRLVTVELPCGCEMIVEDTVDYESAEARLRLKVRAMTDQEKSYKRPAVCGL